MWGEEKIEGLVCLVRKGSEGVILVMIRCFFQEPTIWCKMIVSSNWGENGGGRRKGERK